jgi:hypothetical protein
MKKFKILSLFAALVLFTIAADAQVRTRLMPAFSGGSNSAFGVTGYTISGTGSTDTIAVSDSISYVWPITGGIQYFPNLSFQWTKIGAGTATLGAKFYQCNTSGACTGVTVTNANPLLAGVANTAYSKTYTLSASGVNYIDMLADSVKVSGRYLKVVFFTTSTASVSGAIGGTLNTTLR